MEDKFFTDSFEKLRLENEAMEMHYPDETIISALSLKEVRRAAKNWKVFSSDAPCRVPIPEETGVREIRQLPIELDPPMHSDYRALVEPTFRQPLQPEFQAKLQSIIDDMISVAFSKGKVEVVSEFALPLQSKALTLLLNLPIEESKTWISWGKHVFRSEDDGALDKSKASNLDGYIRSKITDARNSDCNRQDFFSLLVRASVNGVALNDKEIEGIVNLTFAGGRDTVINLITNSIWVFATFPEMYAKLKKEPEIINNAIEEFVRFFSPLSQIGRVAKEDTQFCSHAVKANQRVSLCWASANRDSSVFRDANKLVLDRKQNPHVGFGFGAHNCLGSTHARQIMRQLIPTIIDKIDSFEIVGFEENVEDLAGVKRKAGFEHLKVIPVLKKQS